MGLDQLAEICIPRKEFELFVQLRLKVGVNLYHILL